MPTTNTKEMLHIYARIYYILYHNDRKLSKHYDRMIEYYLDRAIGEHLESI